MAKGILMEEFHVTACAPSGLPTAEYDAMRQALTKGLLARLPGEGPVHFRASVPEHKVLPALIGRFVEGVLGGSAEPLVAYLAGSEKLSAKDLETLRGLCRKIGKEPEKP